MTDDPRLLIDEPLDGVLRLRLNRPAVRNAIDRILADELLEAIDGTGARAIVLESTDSAAFSSGLDLSMGSEERAAVSDHLYEIYEKMLTSPTPIVAAISGPAVGGGAQLAIAADLRVGSPGAAFRFPGGGNGLAVGSWGLASLVGRGRALDLLLTMRTVGADEGLRIGLLDRLEGDARATALDLASTIATLDRVAVASIKRITIDLQGLLDALHIERAQNRASRQASIEGTTRQGGPPP